MIYDVLADVVVRASIRDNAARDLASAMEHLANWVKYCADTETQCDVAHVQEFAEIALRNYREQMKRI